MTAAPAMRRHRCSAGPCVRGRREGAASGRADGRRRERCVRRAGTRMITDWVTVSCARACVSMSPWRPASRRCWREGRQAKAQSPAVAPYGDEHGSCLRWRWPLEHRMNWPRDWRLFQPTTARYGSAMAYPMPSAALLARLSDRLGPAGFTTDPSDLAPWLTDWRRRLTGAAAALLSPADADEAAFVVAQAAAEGVAIVPQGGNSSMVGGATPAGRPEGEGSALLLSLRRMHRIRSISADDNAVVAEAGVVLADLHAAVEAQGRRFPLSLAAKGNATDRRARLHQCGRHAGAALRADARRWCWGWRRCCPMDRCSVVWRPCGRTIAAMISAAADRRRGHARARDGGDAAAGPGSRRARGGLGRAATIRRRRSPCCAGWRIGSARRSRVSSSCPAEGLALVLRHIPGTRAPLERWPGHGTC